MINIDDTIEFDVLIQTGSNLCDASFQSDYFKVIRATFSLYFLFYHLFFRILGYIHVLYTNALRLSCSLARPRVFRRELSEKQIHTVEEAQLSAE